MDTTHHTILRVGAEFVYCIIRRLYGADPPSYDRYGGIQQDTAGYRGIPRDTTGYSGYSGIQRDMWDAERYGEIRRRDTAGYSGIQRDTAGYSKNILQSTGIEIDK